MSDAELEAVIAAVENLKIIQRDRHAWLFSALAVLAGTVEKMAVMVVPASTGWGSSTEP